jgi:hypothetical protein
MNYRAYGILFLWIPFLWCIYNLFGHLEQSYTFVFLFLIPFFGVLEVMALLRVMPKDTRGKAAVVK